MLINFVFVVVTGRLNYIYADEGELTGQRKANYDYLMKYEHMLEPKDLLPTQCWKTWLKGLFKMRTLTRFISWVFAAILQKKSRKGASGQDPMKSFKLGSLMQGHRLPE